MWTCPEHHICKSCRLDIGDIKDKEDNRTCRVHVVEIDGVLYRRKKYSLDDVYIEELRCHDCNVKPGGIHHAFCDMEMCPACNDQLISCECKNKAFLILEVD